MDETALKAAIAAGQTTTEPHASAAPESTPTAPDKDLETLKQFIPFLFDLRDNPTTSANGRSHGTANTSIPGGFAPTKVQLNTNDFLNGFTWDSTNHRFVCVTAGVYSVSGSVAYSNATTAKQYETMIYKNGSQVSQGRVMCSATGAYITPAVTDVLNLAAGDYIELFTQHNDTVNNTIATSSDSTFLAIASV